MTLRQPQREQKFNCIDQLNNYRANFLLMLRHEDALMLILISHWGGMFHVMFKRTTTMVMQ